MIEPEPTDDDAFVAELRSVYRRGAPARLLRPDDIGRLWDFRPIAEDTAELVWDSIHEPMVGVRRRGGAERDVVFGCDSCEISVRLDGPDLLGQLLGMEVVRLDLITLETTQEIIIGDDGCFATDRPDSGPFRIRATSNDGQLVSTAWILN